MRLGQKSFIYFLSKIGATLAGFVATIYLARILGAGTLGTYYLVIAVLTWLKMFSTMGIAKAVNKRISETDEASEFLTAGVLLQAASLLVVTAAIIVFRNQLRSYTGFERIDILLLLLFAGAFFSFVTSVLVGENLTHISGALQPLDRITRTVTQVAFVLLGFNLLGLFFGYILGSILAATVGLYYISARFSYPDRSHFRSLWAYAKFSWLGSFSNRTLASMDTLVLGVFVTSDLIGIYEIAWNVASVLAVFGVAINTGLFHEISSLDADETENIAELAQTGVTYTGVFVIPGLVGGLILGEVILSVYSQEFRQGYLILVLLIFARLISTYKNQFVNVIDAINRSEIVEELRSWRGNSITLEGKSLRVALDDLQRQEIDVFVELEFNRKRGSSLSVTTEFRLVGFLDENGEYHLCFTNLPRDEYPAPDIAQLYRARWKVELLFKLLRSRFRLDEVNTTDPYIIEALVIMTAVSLMMSRVIVDELHKMEAKRRDMTADVDSSASLLSRQQCSVAISRQPI